MPRPTPFQRGVLCGVALAGTAMTFAVLGTIATAVTLAFAEEPDPED